MNLKKGQKINLNEALEFCLELAELGLGLVEPNPCVGSVLFNEQKNELVSWGYHEAYGGPHAEVNCLKNVDDASGLTLVVSLEPCSHYGKTPPCADLVVEKKVSKLIYIEKDPNPLVSGKGLEKIKAAGIEVLQASDELRRKHQVLNDKFLYSFKNKKSYVHLKWAQSKNLKLGVKEKNIQITSPESQLDAHFLRAQSQMVIVGVDTVLKDDPKLDVRLKGFEKDLMVGVIDPDLKLLDKLDDYNIRKLREKNKVFLITDKLIEKGNILSIKKFDNGQLNLNDLRKKTYSDLKVQSLYVEGGANTLRSFIDQSVYNRVSIYESKEEIEEKECLKIFNSNLEMEKNLMSKIYLYRSKNINNDLFKDYYSLK